MRDMKTYLPAFSGFYNTMWEFLSDDDLLESEGIDTDNIDYELFYKELAVLIFDNVKDFLIENKLITGATFEKLDSPKYYNYSTDEIQVSFEMSDKNFDKILEYLTENKEFFQKYLTEKYTTRSGFISNYSNNFDDWILYINELWEQKIDNEHIIGSVLTFICDHMTDNEFEYNVYCDIQEQTNILEYLI